MRNELGRTAAGCALAVACLTCAANAQTPAPAGPVSSAVAAPTYVSIPLEIAVNPTSPPF